MMAALTDSPSQLMPAGWHAADPAYRARHAGAPWTWLLETGSLTRRLQSACDGGFALHVLAESDIDLPADVARLLDVHDGSAARRRDVHLACAGVPCIYALSLIPECTLRGNGSYLAGLGERPLGDALFSDPGLERSAIEVTCLQPGDPLHARITAGARQPVWGRRSVFHTGGSPLLVSEYFLPGLQQCAG